MLKKICIILILLAPSLSFSQVIHQDFQGVIEAKVLNIFSERYEKLPSSNTDIKIQELEVELLSGLNKNQKIKLENDFVAVKVGDKIFVNHLKTVEGRDIYSFKDIDRRASLFFIVAIFIITILIFSGFQGLRSILSLMLSFIVILFILTPLLLKGYSAIFVSIVVGILVLSFAIYATHGLNIRSSLALLSTFLSVSLTSLFAFASINITKLTGFFSDESIYLNLNTGGNLNFQGLLLGGIIIGILGVLDDIAVTQVAVVFELKSLSKNISFSDLYRKSIRVGREHIGALVNTLVLAYTGVSLYLILLFSQSGQSFGYIVNSELFATEIVRTIVGSVGLIITVPITTFLAVYYVNNFKVDFSKYTDHHHIH